MLKLLLIMMTDIICAKDRRAKYKANPDLATFTSCDGKPTPTTEVATPRINKAIAKPSNSPELTYL